MGQPSTEKENLSKSTAPANWKCFAVSFLALGTYSAVLVRLFSPGVMVNDDIAMMSFSNGDFTGTPESQLVFIGILVGGLLKLLYTLNSALPWYALVFVFIQIFSGAVLLTVLFKFLKGQINRPFLCVVGLVALITPVLVLDLSFSTTAMYGSVIGLVCFSLVIENFREQGPLLTGAVAVIFILVSSLRFDFFLAATLLLLPIYLLHLRKLTRFTALLILGMFLLPVVTHFAENQISNREEWATYKEFNDLRGSMHGTPGLSQFVSTAYEDETIAKTRAFGWESEDLLLFGSWYFEDAQRFSTQSLERLKANIDSEPSTLAFQPSLEGIVAGREFLILFGLIVVVFGLSLSVPKFKTFCLIQASWFLTIALAVSSRSRFPDRFALCAILGLYVSLLTANLILVRRQSLDDLATEPKHKRIEVSLFMCLIFSAVFVVPHKFSAEQISNQNLAEASRRTSELEMLDSIDPNGKFAYIGAQIAAEGINPWSERTIFDENQLLGLGWATQSPHQEKRKRSMGLDGNFLAHFVDSPDKYLITSDEIAYLLEHSHEKREKKMIEFVGLKGLTYGTIFKVVSERDTRESVDVASDSVIRQR